MKKGELNYEIIQEHDIFASTKQQLIEFGKADISETKKEKKDTLIIENCMQETQESLDFLLARLEKENKQHMENSKHISSQLLKSRPPLEYFRNLIESRIKDPMISSFRMNKIASVDNITNLDFWIELLADYNTTALQSPHLLTKKIREGIPHPLRGLIWQSMSGAQNTNLEGLFKTLQNEASPYDKVIIRDIPRTFPGVEMFKEEGGDGQKKLQSVLRAFSLYDAEVGYCQGYLFSIIHTSFNCILKSRFYCWPSFDEYVSA